MESVILESFNQTGADRHTVKHGPDSDSDLQKTRSSIKKKQRMTSFLYHFKRE